MPTPVKKRPAAPKLVPPLILEQRVLLPAGYTIDQVQAALPGKAYVALLTLVPAAYIDSVTGELVLPGAGVGTPASLRVRIGADTYNYVSGVLTIGLPFPQPVPVPGGGTTTPPTGGGTTTPPMVTLTGVTLGVTSQSEGTTLAYPATAAYSDTTTLNVSLLGTWSAPGYTFVGNQLTIPANSVVGDSRTLEVTFTYLGVAYKQVVSIVDTSVVVTPPPTGTVGILSYDASAWAWQTGTFGNERLQQFFLADDPSQVGTPEAIPAYLTSLTSGADVVFLMQPGDTVQKIELFDAGGSASGDANAPLELYVRYQGSNDWQRPAMQTFDGSRYNEWRDIGAAATVTALRVRCLGKKATWFKRIRLTGIPGYSPKAPVIRPGRLDNKNAVNSYWYNIFDPANVHGPPPQADLDQLRQYSGWRFYVPQQDVTDDNRLVRMYSARSGGAHYVELAQLLVKEGKFGVYSFMGNSRQNIATWTYTDTDGTVKTDGDLGSNAVWAKGANLLDPESYRHFGEFGWDIGAMMGRVSYPTSQLRQAAEPLNSYDPTPVVYTGLDLFGPDKITPQFGNELSKTWKSKVYPDGTTANAYLPPDAAAVAFAVWRDGYNNTMGARVGICAADPAIQPTIGTLFTADPGYLHAFAEKLRDIYGSNADGSVKNFPLAADVHEYARNPQTGAGVPFTQSPLPTRFAALTRVLDVVSPSSTLVLSEYGYARANAAAGNVDSGAYVSTGFSYLPPTADLPDPAIRRAAALVDTAIELDCLGVGQAYTYDDNHGFRSGTQDIPWDQICDMNGTPAQAWLNRLDQVTTGYQRASFIRQGGGLVARYTKSGAPDLYALTGGATSLAFTDAASVRAYDFASGTLGTAQAIAAGGSYARTASEVPTLLLIDVAAPAGGTNTYAARTTSASPAANSFAYETSASSAPVLSVYEANGYGANGAAVTITGRYFRNDLGLAVDVYMPNGQPVTFSNCVFATSGTSNMAKVNNHTLCSFDNCIFLNDNTQAAGTAMGRAIYAYEPRNVSTTNCLFINTGGCLIDRWSTQATDAQTISWLRNRYVNIRGGAGGDQLRSALQIVNVYGRPGIEIAYNQVVNTPGASRVEDNFNLDCSGTAASPLRLRHNFIRGAFPANPTDSGFTGTGWTTDNSSASNPPSSQPAYILAEYNYAVACMNACANIAAGHHITYRNNQWVVAGVNSSGTKYGSVGNITSMFKGQPYSDAQYDYNEISGNTIRYNSANGGHGYAVNTTDASAGKFYPGPNSKPLVTGNALNTYLDGATTADEDAAFAAWQQQLATDKVLIGAALP